jgi:predicted patatin/cPLA2 family phospholipase
MTRALVVQGGGMRGAYAAGALTALFEETQGYDHVWATSSGAASAAYLLAGQPEGLDIWKDHLHGRRLIKPLRYLSGRDFLDLDYLVDDVFRRRIPLDTRRLRRQSTPLWVPLTDAATGDVRYADLAHHDQPFEVLRAAMALPGAVRRPVTIDGRGYVDGGVVDQFPLRRAIREGATEVTLILTRDPNHRPRDPGPVDTWLATRHLPALRPSLRRRNERLARELETLRNPPQGVTIRTVRPTKIRVRRWTTRRDRLLDAIHQGLNDARHALSIPTQNGLCHENAIR